MCRNETIYEQNGGFIAGNKKWMEKAVEIARKSAVAGGGPFGAIVVKDGEIISTGNNQVTAAYDPTAHAEVQAIYYAASKTEAAEAGFDDHFIKKQERKLPLPACGGKGG